MAMVEKRGSKGERLERKSLRSLSRPAYHLPKDNVTICPTLAPDQTADDEPTLCFAAQARQSKRGDLKGPPAHGTMWYGSTKIVSTRALFLNSTLLGVSLLLFTM